jgi:hypothetical protein
VPGVALTMLTLLSAKRFIKVDFPAFGGPIIVILNPSLIVSPSLAFKI